MHGNRYQVDPGLSGQRVELVFDPFDLTVLSVRSGGRDAGTATPHHITRHSRPKARPEPLPGDDAPRATGIDYLALLGEQRRRPGQGAGQLQRPHQPRTRPPRADDDEQEQDGRGAGGRRPWMTSARSPAASRCPATAPCPGPRGRRGDPRPEQATGCDAGLGQPSAAYDVIGALSLAASRLGQLLTQITG